MRCKRPSTEGSTLITPRPFVFPGTCLVVDTEHWFVLKDREATQTWGGGRYKYEVTVTTEPNNRTSGNHKETAASTGGEDKGRERGVEALN